MCNLIHLYSITLGIIEENGGGAFFKAPRHPFPTYEKTFFTHTFQYVFPGLALNVTSEEPEPPHDLPPPLCHREVTSRTRTPLFAELGEGRPDCLVRLLGFLWRDHHPHLLQPPVTQWTVSVFSSPCRRCTCWRVLGGSPPWPAPAVRPA